MTFKRDILTEGEKAWGEKQIDEAIDKALADFIDMMNQKLKKDGIEDELDELDMMFFKQLMLMKMKKTLTTDYFDVKMFNITREGLEYCGFTDEPPEEGGKE